MQPDTIKRALHSFIDKEEGEQKGEKIYCLNMRGGTAWKGWHTAHKVKEKDLKETVDKYIGWGMVDKSKQN